MCLSKVHWRLGDVGYKVVEKREIWESVPPQYRSGEDSYGTRKQKYLSWDFSEMAGLVEYPLNEWTTDKNMTRIKSNRGESYPAGFHCYLDLKAAVIVRDACNVNHGVHLAIIKCEIRDVVAFGSELYELSYPDTPAIIARTIRNIGEVE